MIIKDSKIKLNKLNIFIYSWCLLIVIFAILNFILFVSPYWLTTHTTKNTSFNDRIKLGDESNYIYSTKNVRTGYFGLYKYCIQTRTIQNKINSIRDNLDVNSTSEFDLKQDSIAFVKCIGEWNQLKTFVNVYFAISTCLVGFACVLGVLCIAVCFWIIFFTDLPQIVLFLSSFIQIANGVLILSACIIYPFGWSDSRVKEICKSGVYNRGTCEINWTFILAIIQSAICISSSLAVYLVASNKSIFKESNSFLQSVKSILRFKQEIPNKNCIEGIEIYI